MIVVAIIGLLLGIALPSFVKVRKRAQAAAFVSSLRVATDAFTMRAAEVGQFPPDGMPGGGCQPEWLLEWLLIWPRWHGSKELQ